MQTMVETSVPASAPSSAKKLWEEAYPGRASAVFDALGPCYESAVSIGSPSVHGENAMDTATAVYHWLVQVNGSFGRVVSQRYLSRFRNADPSDFQWLDMLLRQRYPSFRGQFLIPDACVDAMIEGNANGFEHLKEVLPTAFRIRLWESYMHTVTCGFAYAVRGEMFPEEAAYFKRLIRVWHSGRLPVGLGKTFRGADAVIFAVREP